MMKLKKIICILLTIGFIPILSGCWNYREVDELSIVHGVAIDRNKEGKYVVTIEAIAPKGGEEFSLMPDVFISEGNTTFDAIRTLITLTSRKAYWSHAKVLVVSEKIAREGMAPILDYVSRDAEMRENMWLLISREETARHLFDGRDKMHDTISVHIDEMLNSQRYISKYYGIQLWEYLDDLSNSGISPIVPTAKMTQKGEEYIPQIYGTAVFKKDQMVGVLDGIESRSLLFLRGELEGGIIAISKAAGSDTDVSLEIFNSKTKVTPVVENEKVRMKIDIKLDVAIAELAGPEDFISEKGLEKLKKVAEDHVKDDLQQLIKKLQKEYKTDAVGFGRILHMKKPLLWKEMEGDWTSHFTTLDTDINVDILIRGSAVTSKPLKVGD